MAATPRAPMTEGGFRCPICGAWEAEGGCREVRECITALAAEEKECTRETVAALANRSRSQEARILGAGLEALSVLHIGVVLCSAAGKVIGANQIAEAILSTRDGLGRTPEGMLCATRANTQPIAEIVQRVAAPTRAGRFANNAAVVALYRDSRRRPLTVFLRPSHVSLNGRSGTKTTVLLIILDSALPVRAIESELRQLYGLTSTEARLANVLMEGKALEDCCRDLGMRRSTGCTHLRRLFKKTGVHRQSELVALLLKSIGLACPGSPSPQPVFLNSAVLEEHPQKGPTDQRLRGAV
ncbi:MAG: helix-turn-helix transcriptional regulator [Terriglobales bacterium]